MMFAVVTVFALLAAIDAQTTSGPKPFLALGDNRGNSIWSDFGSVARYEITVYEANIPSEKWKILGHHAQGDWDNLKQRIHAFQDRTTSQDGFAAPTGFTQLWNCQGDTTWQKGSFWRVSCPAGYVSLGDIAIEGNELKEAPKAVLEKVRCVKEMYTAPCSGWKVKLWDNDSSIARKDASVWEPETNANTFSEFFYAHTKHDERPDVSAFCLKTDSFEIL